MSWCTRLVFMSSNLFSNESNYNCTRSKYCDLQPTTSQKKTRVKIWLYEDTRMAIEGQIIGFDEYMNFVLEGATEVDTKTGKKSEVGRILLKGDAITLMQEA